MGDVKKKITKKLKHNEYLNELLGGWGGGTEFLPIVFPSLI